MYRAISGGRIMFNLELASRRVATLGPSSQAFAVTVTCNDKSVALNSQDRSSVQSIGLGKQERTTFCY